jgi:hypothetical protein
MAAVLAALRQSWCLYYNLYCLYYLYYCRDAYQA